MNVLLVLSWSLFALGVVHIAYGWIRLPALREAMAGGGVQQFGKTEGRRTALWFVLFGPMLMLAGQVAAHAVTAGDLGLVRLVGAYLLGVSLAGALALPRPPFVAGMLIAALLLAGGAGWF